MTSDSWAVVGACMMMGSRQGLPFSRAKLLFVCTTPGTTSHDTTSKIPYCFRGRYRRYTNIRAYFPSRDRSSHRGIKIADWDAKGTVLAHDIQGCNEQRTGCCVCIVSISAKKTAALIESW